jgi:hypothetical protein
MKNKSLADHKNKILAENIVSKIIQDLGDRRGLRQEWERVDDEIKCEIREEWINTIMEVLKKC